jgi:DNA replication protein DnaC
MTTPTPSIDPELGATLRRLKLGRILDTLPERLTLARSNELSHAEFLQLVLADEISRRDSSSIQLRARSAGLDATMTLEHWDDASAITFDRQMWNDLCTLRFVEDAHNVIVMGPVGVGKTFLATALGHIAVRRHFSVHFERADRLLKRLGAARLDNSHDAELRKLLRIDVLILDDFALAGLDASATADVYEIIVERHKKTSTIITSNREPAEWLTLMADPLLAQSAVDRLQSAAYELVVDGESYRRRQKPTTTLSKP